MRRVGAEAVRPLRLRVLRAGQPPSSAVWPGDDDPRAAHFAVVDGDGERIVAVASLVPGEEPGVVRLRGMATDPAHRGRGHGAALVDACVAHARQTGERRVWCAARVAAIPLYERAGFVRESGVYEVEGIGPHVRLGLDLGVAPSAPDA